MILGKPLDTRNGSVAVVIVVLAIIFAAWLFSGCVRTNLQAEREFKEEPCVDVF
jgi:hypothetical protein